MARCITKNNKVLVLWNKIGPLLERKNMFLIYMHCYAQNASNIDSSTFLNFQNKERSAGTHPTLRYHIIQYYLSYLSIQLLNTCLCTWAYGSNIPLSILPNLIRFPLVRRGVLKQCLYT